MTTTDPALCTNAPTTGFNIPVMANKIARKLRPKEKIKLHLMVIIILLLQYHCQYLPLQFQRLLF